MANFRILLLLGCLLVASATAAYASDPAADAAIYNELESSSYQLASQLASHGTSSIVIPEFYTKNGIWAEDRFVFPGAPEDTEVLISGDKIDNKPIEIIQLQLSSSLTRTLEFSQIQAQPKLVLMFKAPPQVPDDKAITSIYIRVYVGKRLLDRLRITTDPEWIRKEYTLGNAQFLKQKLVLTLNMSCDSEQALIMLYGYLKS